MAFLITTACCCTISLRLPETLLDRIKIEAAMEKTSACLR
jgi:predicted DNA binding CopG/RHH family protein